MLGFQLVATNPFPPRCRDKFRMERLIARGGFGRVYLATQVDLERKVAVKILDTSVLDNSEDVMRFLAEARITAALNHPNIVKVIDHDVEDGLPWIAYEFLAGKNLRDRLIEHGRLPLDSALSVTAQVASALSEAHAQEVFHRDIKPDNIQEDDTGVYKVTDFGIAKWGTSGAIRTQAGIIVGTPAYLAPEQIRGQTVTPQTDLYALGIVLFETLAGKPPFESDLPIHVLHQHLDASPPPLSAVRDDVPESVEAIIRTALAKKPEDRFPGAAAMQAALEKALEEARELEKQEPKRKRRTTNRQAATVRVGWDRAHDAYTAVDDGRGKRPLWAALTVIGLFAGVAVAVTLRPSPPSPTPTDAPSIAASMAIAAPPPTPSPPSPKAPTRAELAKQLTTPEAAVTLENRAQRTLEELSSGSPAARNQYAELLDRCGEIGEHFLGPPASPAVQLIFADVVSKLLAPELAGHGPAAYRALDLRVMEWADQKSQEWLPLVMKANRLRAAGATAQELPLRQLALSRFQAVAEASPGDAANVGAWLRLEGDAAAPLGAQDDRDGARTLARGHRDWMLRLATQGKLAQAGALRREIERRIRELLAPAKLNTDERAFAQDGKVVEARLADLWSREEATAKLERAAIARARFALLRERLGERAGRVLTPLVVDQVIEETVEVARSVARRAASDARAGADLARVVADLRDLAPAVMSPPLDGVTPIGPQAAERFVEAAGLTLRPALAPLAPAAYKAHFDEAAGWLKHYPDAWAAWHVEALKARAGGDLENEGAALLRAVALFHYEHVEPVDGRPARAVWVRPWASLQLDLIDWATRKRDPKLVEKIAVGYRNRARVLDAAGLMSSEVRKKMDAAVSRALKGS